MAKNNKQNNKKGKVPSATPSPAPELADPVDATTAPVEQVAAEPVAEISPKVDEPIVVEEDKPVAPVKEVVIVEPVAPAPTKESTAQPPAIDTQETAAPAEDEVNVVDPVIEEEKEPEFAEDILKIDEERQVAGVSIELCDENAAPKDPELKKFVFLSGGKTMLGAVNVDRKEKTYNRENIHDLFKDREYDYPIWLKPGVKDGNYPMKKKACCYCC